VVWSFSELCNLERGWWVFCDALKAQGGCGVVWSRGDPGGDFFSLFFAFLCWFSGSSLPRWNFSSRSRVTYRVRVLHSSSKFSRKVLFKESRARNNLKFFWESGLGGVGVSAYPQKLGWVPSRPWNSFRAREVLKITWCAKILQAVDLAITVWAFTVL
jgi:hypothetical protein